MATRELDAEVAAFDALELPLAGTGRRIDRVWRAVWPKVAAVGLAVLAWQVVVWSHWKPEYTLRGPAPVFSRLASDVTSASLWRAIGVTMRRAAVGYAIAVLIGSAVGAAVARVPLLRNAFGSLITGLQTMPSIAWFPLAIILFKLGESAILFVVILGAAPAVANGVISGIDHIPPLLLRAGRVLGARGLNAYRHVVIPAAFPAFLAGLKQGWAFAWRSLMAGELIATASGSSLGGRLQNARELADFDGLLATMVVILIIGIVVDSLFFGSAERAVRRRWGLVDAAA